MTENISQLSSNHLPNVISYFSHLTAFAPHLCFWYSHMLMHLWQAIFLLTFLKYAAHVSLSGISSFFTEPFWAASPWYFLCPLFHTELPYGISRNQKSFPSSLHFPGQVSVLPWNIILAFKPTSLVCCEKLWCADTRLSSSNTKIDRVTG